MKPKIKIDYYFYSGIYGEHASMNINADPDIEITSILLAALKKHSKKYKNIWKIELTDNENININQFKS